LDKGKVDGEEKGGTDRGRNSLRDRVSENEPLKTICTHLYSKDRKSERIVTKKKLKR